MSLLPITRHFGSEQENFKLYSIYYCEGITSTAKFWKTFRIELQMINRNTDRIG